MLTEHSKSSVVICHFGLIDQIRVNVMCSTEDHYAFFSIPLMCLLPAF